jgi:hypothetical protein
MQYTAVAALLSRLDALNCSTLHCCFFHSVVEEAVFALYSNMLLLDLEDAAPACAVCPGMRLLAC